MKGFKEFGVAMTGVFPVFEAVELAKSAEKLGLGSVWFAEDYFFRGVVPYIAAAAMETERIKVGLGVINCYSRHPALIAMEFATLDEMLKGRGIYGLGSGVPYWMTQMGYDMTKPLSRTRECVDLINKIMSFESITYDGQFFIARDIKLIFEPLRKKVPIFLAFEGKMGLKLCGEIADGAILSVFNTPSYVKFAIDRFNKGAKKAQRSLDDFEIVAYLPMVIDDDLDKAIAIARDFVKLYFPVSSPDSPLMNHAGITPKNVTEFKEAAEKGEDVGALITDKMVQATAVVGSVETCIKHIQGILDAGANTPVLFPVPGTVPVHTGEILSEEIAPHLR